MKKLMIVLALLIGFSSLAYAGGMSRRQWNSQLPDGKLVQMHESFQNLATASTTGRYSASIATATLVAGATIFTSAMQTQSPAPRNATITFSTTTLTGVTGSLVIVGVNNRGQATTETIAISTQSTTSGAVCWRTITTATLTMTTITGASGDLLVSFGTGAIIGLANNIKTTSGVTFVNEAGTKTTTYTANATYDSIDFVTDPDGSNDYEVYYNTTLW